MKQEAIGTTSKAGTFATKNLCRRCVNSKFDGLLNPGISETEFFV